jgi:serine/threonine-protein kinase
MCRAGRLLGFALLAVLVPPLSAEVLPRFPAASVWRQDVSAATVHPQSASMIAVLAGEGGFGFGRMQIDFGFRVVHAAPGAPTRTIVGLPVSGGYYHGDCEPVGTAMPVPPGAAIEGQAGLTCNNDSEDCHLLVVQGDLLYEAYRVDAIDASTLEAQCLVIWRLNFVYPPEGRGEHCTSADAAGFPIAPLLFNADEIASALAQDPTGNTVDLGHAVRFILPNDNMASFDGSSGSEDNLYVRPASHAGDPSGPESSVPYGSRLRLRPDFPLAGYDPAARVLLNTFKRYGIVLADGGNIALTAEDDIYTPTKWDDLGVDSRIFDQTPGATDVTVSDFQVLDTGPRIAETYECVRTDDDRIFADGLEKGDVTAWSSGTP